MKLAPDGEGGVFAVWADKEVAWESDLYGQRIDSRGRARWAAGGMIIAEEPNYQDDPVLLPGSEGLVTVSWQDNRSGDYDMYALKLRLDGRRANHPAPFIMLVEDVPADQGEQVSVSWGPSPLEDYSPGTITDYSVYLYDGSTWDFISATPASGQNSYSVEVGVPCYQIPSDTCWQKFMVTAGTSDSMTYYESLPDSGYAIDNTAPAQVTGLTGGYHFQYKMDLHWNPNSETDLSHYCVHRCSVPDFVPDGSTMRGTCTDTTYLDNGIFGGDYFYKVFAADLAGNEGEPDTWDITLSTQLESFSTSAGPGWVELRWILSEKDPGTSFAVRRTEDPGRRFLPVDGAVNATSEMSYSFRDNHCTRGRRYRYQVFVTDDDGTRLLFETGPLMPDPVRAMLFQNYPNPFNPSTEIAYFIPERMLVELTVYDTAGRLIAKLDSGIMEKGYHSVGWNGCSSSGEGMGSGVYFCRLKAGKKHFSRKIVLIR
ncbi:MAG: T9SS type A sorting domain-containing protein [Candidatus Latescibacteria bacterium]|nr:T9SS type A sorting domain-containing protein [bacterium]MBD3424197.1 T9SS type A sorting domain-containing protein [Candidatus Latescibacterota bacterium]